MCIMVCVTHLSNIAGALALFTHKVCPDGQHNTHVHMHHDMHVAIVGHLRLAH